MVLWFLMVPVFVSPLLHIYLFIFIIIFFFFFFSQEKFFFFRHDFVAPALVSAFV